jgi:hypothetical protein
VAGSIPDRRHLLAWLHLPALDDDLTKAAPETGDRILHTAAVSGTPPDVRPQQATPRPEDRCHLSPRH